MGQYCGEMLAETGSFDVLLWYWVLGIGYSVFGYIRIYILHTYIYIYTYYIYTYLLNIGYGCIYNMRD